jgi:hypothetical protein
MNKRNTLVINIFGGPSISKSTTAAGVFSLLKLHGIECELALEYAKDLIWEERHKTIKDQQYLFGKQYHRLWRLVNNVDVIVTDCPLLLSVVYGKRYDVVVKSFADNVIDAINSFNNFNVVLDRVKPFNENGRNVTEVQAKEIDKEIIDTLKYYKMDYINIPGNFEGINTIVHNILRNDPTFKINKV